MKAHVGTDRRGVVHSLTTTPANVHDSTQIAQLLHGQECYRHPLSHQPLRFAPVADRTSADMGIYQGALSRLRQEHRAPVHRFRAGQPVSAATTLAAAAGEVSLLNRPDRQIDPNRFGNQAFP